MSTTRILGQEQKTPVAPTSPAAERASGSSAPAVPNVPTVPSVPAVAPVPNVPTVPPVPTVAPVPNVPNVDPFGEVMFSPDLIMRHARELKLTDEQKAFMRSEVQRTTTRFNELQWQLQDAMETLVEVMKSNVLDEQQILGHLDKVLNAEREIKRLHIGMGVRIKNQLTPEQQAQLRAIKGLRKDQIGSARHRPTISQLYSS
jgi:Spy/CpxP family protein refolding chaperone